MSFQLFSSAFPEGGRIPLLNSCQGADVSPPLEWNGSPADTRTFALVVEDPDAPGGVFTHWLLWDIPGTVRALPQGYKPGPSTMAGRNGFGSLAYRGPCPPKGHGVHRYFFRLYALTVDSLNLQPASSPADLYRALQGKILAEANAMGTFER